MKRLENINSVKLLFILYNSSSQLKATIPLQEMITLAVITILHAFTHFWNE